jgi:hypothetical protein
MIAKEEFLGGNQQEGGGRKESMMQVNMTQVLYIYVYI